MDTCILCLQKPCSFNSYIPINQQVVHMIETHFWPINDQQNTLGVCFLCWTKLSDFHKFYEKISEANGRITNICNKNKLTYDGIHPQMVQIPTYLVRKPNNTFIEEQYNIANDLDGSIKIENTHDKYETICDWPKTNDEVDSEPTPLEKRKRGRPRKNHVKPEILVKKSKGKRGRPRKINLKKPEGNDHARKINLKKPKGKRGRPRKIQLNINGRHTENCSLWENSKTNSELETSSQSVFITTIRNGIPPKKNGRGRPRKIQNNSEHSHTNSEVSDSAIPENLVSVQESFKSQNDQIIKGKASKLNEQNLRMVNKPRNIFSLMKKRKRLQQHKALIMRNYIATSVRCMQFLKK